MEINFLVQWKERHLWYICRTIWDCYIDLGIKTFATLSNGKKIDAPKPQKKRIKKYRKLSKSLSKKTKASKGYEKARLKIAKFRAKLKDIRKDFLHKLSTEMSVKTKQLF